MLQHFFLIQADLELTKRPPAIMALIATIAFTAANPRASAIAWKPIWKRHKSVLMSVGS